MHSPPNRQDDSRIDEIDAAGWREATAEDSVASFLVDDCQCTEVHQHAIVFIGERGTAAGVVPPILSDNNVADAVLASPFANLPLDLLDYLDSGHQHVLPPPPSRRPLEARGFSPAANRAPTVK